MARLDLQEFAQPRPTLPADPFALSGGITVGPGGVKIGPGVGVDFLQQTLPGITDEQVSALLNDIVPPDLPEFAPPGSTPTLDRTSPTRRDSGPPERTTPGGRPPAEVGPIPFRPPPYWNDPSFRVWLQSQGISLPGPEFSGNPTVESFFDRKYQEFLSAGRVTGQPSVAQPSRPASQPASQPARPSAPLVPPPNPLVSAGRDANTFDDPATALLQDFINFRINELLDPVQDPRRQLFAKDLESRMDQLRQPPFTTSEESALRTRSQDEIERLRAATQRNALERISQRGFAPTSGLAEQAAQDIDEQFNTLRAQESGQFGAAAVSEQQRRLDQAVELANSLASLESIARAEEDQRRAEILALTSLGAELPERRLQLALATLGQQPPPGSLFNSVAALTALGQDQQRLALEADLARSQQNQGFGLGLGSIIANLLQPQSSLQGPAQSAPLLPSQGFTFPVTGFPTVPNRVGISSFL